ncbi:3-carboxyethylcatechol 2,3-dioxygenase [Amorphus sp. 3PC139-8]|uniref:3-carboxyethylcatechol 2,3-dioxygenase n=1 Tax=Amorphus sp. 3PC139-8 TaxID=2735676 RepID=UPI00345D1A9B
MIVGSVCISHSPLIETNRAQPRVEERFGAALDKAAGFVAQLEPELTVLFYPDHLNGFFYNLLPSFCIGIEGRSIGDYGTRAGALEIPQERAMEMARSVLEQGVDAAISYRMEVDHGAAQPMELLSARHDISRVIPVFINCAAEPRPTFARVRALGRAVGNWARATPERVLIVGSGGLSHDPPMPSLATATPEIRARLIDGGELDAEQRAARETRAAEEGRAMAAGTSPLLPLDPSWDRMLLDAFLTRNLDVLDSSPDEEITGTGGRGGHEIRTWFAALAALGDGYRAEELFYEPISEWIAGMGMIRATAA